MSFVKDKYRGTRTYFHVMSELVRAGQYRGLTTYQDIAVMMGLPLRGSHMGPKSAMFSGKSRKTRLPLVAQC